LTRPGVALRRGRMLAGYPANGLGLLTQGYVALLLTLGCLRAPFQGGCRKGAMGLKGKCGRGAGAPMSCCFRDAGGTVALLGAGVAGWG